MGGVLEDAVGIDQVEGAVGVIQGLAIPHFQTAGEAFVGEVLPTAKKVVYHLNLKRVIMRKLVLGIADGIMKVDGRTIYEAKDLKVGLFAASEAV